jgi:pyruvate/2-oxoglutarate/acetoin dehydrogenase E1 component
MMVDTALAAADKLADCGISAEIIDPRTLVPLDLDMIKRSVLRTGALIVIDESFPTCSFAAEIVAAVSECPQTFLGGYVSHQGAYATCPHLCHSAQSWRTSFVPASIGCVPKSWQWSMTPEYIVDEFA